MTDPDHAASPAETPAVTGRRSSLWVVLPLALFVIAGLGWTAAWFYAAGRAEKEIDSWIANEAAAGRQWNCADRRLTGFPFRFELACAQPSVTFTGSDPWQWSAARAHAVAQVWDPQHIIAEFQGPSVLKEPTSGRSIEANWSLLQVSAVGSGGVVDRVSTSANDYVLSEGGRPLFFARHAELHARHHPGADGNTLDVAIGLKGAGSGALNGGTQAAADAELQATISQVPPFQAMPVAERLRLWQEAGGKVKVEVAKLSAGGGAMNATGDIGLDGQRRPAGALTLAVANPQGLMGALGGSGLLPEQAASLAPLLMAAGMPTTLDGAKASAFPFVFRDGRVALGLIPLGKIGPLY
ncbi:DUF2125 domain-containing protein [Ancylobacter sp. Lp-2]|uniref:DUF2125 domain-containing protein n=1 Tax=Ancylobacter sp. Lp-2 TaxID=2881339 RepID=UPI001E520910|nr:DUF2125 domain-containing protein [Ancylobacter sp. Lp-2]MCB4766999.1 DUF2125 domain-containing protein [Ancylobacter sp. Lp-2]